MEQQATPGTHFVEYSDGTFAEYASKRIEIVEDGIKVYKIWLKPGKDIISLFDLKIGEQLNQFGFIEKEYDFNDVNICRDDPMYSRIWIETDYAGNPTPFSLRNERYKEQIKYLQQEVTILKASMAAMIEEQKKMLTAKKEWMKDAAGVFEEALKVRRTKQPIEGEEEGEGYGG